ncbi:hypothetical protein [Arthrobacter sp. CAN_C5]|uniref:hypothetical protein n=1 Tax=Arthrobacter sp. CAN_C5 TaxID=2760706 RepID=UPI001AE9BA2F|nr:hypothetical protein [Arthrobacter sp. CAN_C5]MBP2216523.1 hypothetical protein [Arthrobacter sp. CAN_C5]
MKSERLQVENRIRAAIRQLLEGEVPLGMKRDITSLCSIANVSRATMYRTYPHLKAEFEQQRFLRDQAGPSPGSTPEQEQKLQTERDRLQFRLAEMASKVRELENFKEQALSRLAAQNEELLRLRSNSTNVENKVQSIR